VPEPGHGPDTGGAGGRSEEVLVVPRAQLFAAGAVGGFSPHRLEQFLAAIAAHAYFAPRECVEEDPERKQIIPYAVLRHAGRIFLVRRTAAGSEARLRDKFSIGIGGHINPEDVGDAADPVGAGLRRELEEELVLPPGWRARPAGVLNDDAQAVGSVHFGLVYLVDVPAPDVRVRETAKLQGAFATPAEIRAVYDRLETWSRFVADALLRNALE
jgi:predicted NUDIX family phosphoesterase